MNLVGLTHRTAFIVLVTAIIMYFTCTQPCSAQFSSRGGLARHRNNCTIYKTAATLRTKRRQAVPSKAPIVAQPNAPENPIDLGLYTVRLYALIHSINTLVELYYSLASKFR